MRDFSYKGSLRTNKDGVAEKDFPVAEYQYVVQYGGIKKNETFTLDHPMSISIDFEKAAFKLPQNTILYIAIAIAIIAIIGIIILKKSIK